MNEDAELVLLPGLDGTGLLFAPLLKQIGDRWVGRAIRYPTDRTLSYDQLVNNVEIQLAGHRPIVLVGESFSGPIALKLAVKHPARVQGVILCASFIQCPIPRWFAALAAMTLRYLPITDLGIRMLLLGRHAPSALVSEVRQAITSVPDEIVAHRVRMIMEVDCASDLNQCGAPILYLRGRHDLIVRSRSTKEIVTIRPDVSVRTVDAAHMLLQSAPAETWAAMNEFLLAIKS